MISILYNQVLIMSFIALNVIQAANEINGPPGLTHPLLVENYAWVDRSLREMYEISEFEVIKFSCLAPLTWVNYRDNAELDCIEDNNSEIIKKRRRSESDISDYESEIDRVINRLNCQSPIFTGKYLFSSLANKYRELSWDELQEIELQEFELMNSFNPESLLHLHDESISPITIISDINTDFEEMNDSLENCSEISQESYYSLDSY